MQTTKVLNPKKINIVEYSVSQKCFHINTLDTAITQNLRGIGRGGQPDFVVVGMAETYEEAIELSEKIEAELNNLSRLRLVEGDRS